MREDIISFLNETAEEEQPFFIEMTGISYCDETYRIVRKNSPIYVFEYILKGEGTVIVEDKKFIARQGDVYILHCHSNHQYYSDRDNPWTKIWFNAKGPLIDSLVQLYRLRHTNHIEGIDVSKIFYELLGEAWQAKNNAAFLETVPLLFLKLILALSLYVHKEDPPYSKEAGLLKDYLDKNNRKRVELKDLCNQIYHSPSQTIRIFKKAFGITPYQYLIGQRMELAKLLLLNSNKSIKEISLELSFYDEHYFSNIFKEKVGMSPGKWRERSRGIQ